MNAKCTDLSTHRYLYKIGISSSWMGQKYNTQLLTRKQFNLLTERKVIGGVNNHNLEHFLLQRDKRKKT